MIDSKEEFLKRLATNNPVDVRQLAQLAAQLDEIARAGVIQPRGYSLDRPLGRPVATGRPETLANTLKAT